MEGNVSGQSDVEGQLEVCCAVTHPGAGFKSTILAIFGEGEADAAEVFGYRAVCGHASSGDVDGGKQTDNLMTSLRAKHVLNRI